MPISKVTEQISQHLAWEPAWPCAFREVASSVSRAASSRRARLPLLRFLRPFRCSFHHKYPWLYRCWWSVGLLRYLLFTSRWEQIYQTSREAWWSVCLQCTGSILLHSYSSTAPGSFATAVICFSPVPAASRSVISPTRWGLGSGRLLLCTFSQVALLLPTRRGRFCLNMISSPLHQFWFTLLVFVYPFPVPGSTL
jgi:hypothetical protein